MNLVQSILIYFIAPVLSLITILIIAQVILSWLVSFNIMNLRNPLMANIYYTLNKFVEPILKPIRSIIPSVGGLDFSPIIAFFILQWLQGFVVPSLYKMLG